MNPEQVTCISCGYDLYGLDSDSICPECGTPTSQSLRGAALQFSNRHWLKTLRRGIALLLLNIVLFVLTSVLSSLHGPASLVSLAGLFNTCLRTLAIFLLTLQEPAASTTEKRFTLRRVMRVLAVLTVALSPLPDILDDAVWFTNVISVLGTVLRIATECTILIYLRRLAARVPNHHLVRVTPIVMWGKALSRSSRLALGIYGELSGRTVFWRTVPMLPSLTWAVWLASLVFGAWYALLLVQYYRAIKPCALEADKRDEDATDGVDT